MVGINRILKIRLLLKVLLLYFYKFTLLNFITILKFGGINLFLLPPPKYTVKHNQYIRLILTSLVLFRDGLFCPRTVQNTRFKHSLLHSHEFCKISMLPFHHLRKQPHRKWSLFQNTIRLRLPHMQWLVVLINVNMRVYIFCIIRLQLTNKIQNKYKSSIVLMHCKF